MGKKADISSQQKAQVGALLVEKKSSYAKIAEIVGISKSSVVNISKTVARSSASTLTFSNRRHNCRGKRITTPRMDRRIVQKALQERSAPARTILKDLNQDGIEISLRTLERRFKENSLSCRRPAKKPKLTQNMRQRRLYWSQIHRNFGNDYWNKVIFSDECRLEAVTETSKFVRRKPHERYSDNCILKTVKHPPSVMIWSCITAEGPGPIYFVEGTMRSSQYIELLKKFLEPYLDTLEHPKQDYIFMQDGAPCHTSRASMDCLNSLDLEVLPWPGNSPDLNPIENCWAYLKSKVYSRRNNTIAELKKNIEDVWNNDDGMRQMMVKCIESLPKRVHEVLKAKGGSTKY